MAQALLHAPAEGMEGDAGIAVAEALLHDVEDAAHQEETLPEGRGVEEKDADGGVEGQRNGWESKGGAREERICFSETRG